VPIPILVVMGVRSGHSLVLPPRSNVGIPYVRHDEQTHSQGDCMFASPTIIERHRFLWRQRLINYGGSADRQNADTACTDDEGNSVRSDLIDDASS